jgi:TolA-binding protein
LLACLGFACGGSAARQETMTIVAPPPTRECPKGTVFNGVDCAELLAHATELDSGTQVLLSSEALPVPDDARELRPMSKRTRSAALLAAEIQGLESLRNATNQNAPDYPQIVRRLAEDYSELAYSNHNPHDARNHAITEYALLKNSFPSYAQLDEVHYYLAYTYELENDMSSARKVYYELIQKFPSSKWIPYAYYAFGDLFYREAKSDPSKWQLAHQAFLEVQKFSSSAIQPWALLRLGQTFDAMGDHAKAQLAWTRLKSQYPQSAAVAQIP